MISGIISDLFVSTSWQARNGNDYVFALSNIGNFKILKYEDITPTTGIFHDIYAKAIGGYASYGAIDVVGNIVAIATSTGLYFMDISNIEAPLLRSEVKPRYEAFLHVQLSNSGYAFAIDRLFGNYYASYNLLRIFDIRDLDNPVEIVSIEFDMGLVGMALSYNETSKILIISCSPPYSPNLSSKVHIYDVSVPE